MQLVGYLVIVLEKESSVQIISIFALSAGKGFHTVEFLLKIEISRKPKLDLFSQLVVCKVYCDDGLRVLPECPKTYNKPLPGLDKNG